MQTDTDSKLLTEYARSGSEQAFRDLVDRHIHMVHSAALRESHGNVPFAEDVTQAVFTQLSRGASKLVTHPAIAGWLYTCVRLTAANARRGEARRQRREQEAIKMNELCWPNPSDHVWQEVRPVLDDVMHELDHGDRAAVVLRFFEGQSLEDVGAALGLSENTARMRVERSLDKLHALLTRRGVKSTASTLEAVIVAGAVMSAPAALASRITAGALASSTARGAGTGLVSKWPRWAGTRSAVTGAAAALVAILLLLHSIRTQPEQTKALSAPQSAAVAADSTSAPTQIHSQALTTATASTNAPSQMNFNLVDAVTGQPLAGAKINLSYIIDGSRDKSVNAVTDANGRMAVGMLGPPYLDLYLSATAEGYVPKIATWGRIRPMPSDFTMKLDHGVTIGGSVVDQAGNPIVGAEIRFSVGYDPFGADSVAFARDDSMAVTDSKGHWSCNKIPLDQSIHLHATHSEHAQTNLFVKPYAPDANQILITMPDGFRVAGTVLATNGQPIAGATVRQAQRGDGQSVTTDSGGAFEFGNVEAGQQMLAVQAHGFAPGVQTFEVTSNVDTLKFQLGPGQLLRGRVVDDQGNPVANAAVEVSTGMPDKIKWSTNSDASGRFEWDSAPVEPQRYLVAAQGFKEPAAVVIPADGSEKQVQLERFQEGTDFPRITGTVVDADSGLPLDQFNVFLSDSVRGSQDADGSFLATFYAVENDGKLAMSLQQPTGPFGYRVQIEKDGYLPVVSATVSRDAGDQTLEFKMHKGAGPTGTVLPPSGEPAVNTTVYLCTSSAGVTMDNPAHAHTWMNTTTYKSQTDSSGNFSVRPAVEPQGLVIIHDQGYAEVSRSEMPAGARITVQPWGRVQGQLLLDSRPVANQRIYMAGALKHPTITGRRQLFMGFNFDTATDAEGRFSFEKVPPGKCRIYQPEPISFSSLTALEASADIKAGELTEVVLGGAGRAVVGKATLPGTTASIDWRRVPVQLQTKDDADPVKRFGASCYSDGSFRLADVPAGTYVLQIKVFDAKLNSAAPHSFSEPTDVQGSLTRDVVVPDGQAAEAIDLGTLELQSQLAGTGMSTF